MESWVEGRAFGTGDRIYLVYQLPRMNATTVHVRGRFVGMTTELHPGYDLNNPSHATQVVVEDDDGEIHRAPLTKIAVLRQEG